MPYARSLRALARESPEERETRRRANAEAMREARAKESREDGGEARNLILRYISIGCRWNVFVALVVTYRLVSSKFIRKARAYAYTCKPVGSGAAGASQAAHTFRDRKPLSTVYVVLRQSAPRLRIYMVYRCYPRSRAFEGRGLGTNEAIWSTPSV